MLGFDLGLLLVVANKWIRGMNGIDDSNESKQRGEMEVEGGWGWGGGGGVY